MGLVGSRPRLRRTRTWTTGDRGDGDDDATPVMGDGHCPLYDAALLGDWDRVVALCEAAATVATEATATTRPDPAPAEEPAGVRRARAGDRADAEVRPLLEEAPCESSDEEKESPAEVLHDDRKCNGNGGHVVATDEADTSVAVDLPRPDEEGEDRPPTPPPPPRPLALFVDARGSTPLHAACRRDPPLRAVRALLAAHPASVWRRSAPGGWVPLHLACHCGCDADAAAALLDAMEASLPRGAGDDDDDADDDAADDPLLPRDARGRTPLHLACAARRDPARRPDLVRLLLLRSRDPRRAATARDTFFGAARGRVGRHLAAADLRVLTGKLDLTDDGDGDGDGGGEIARVASHDSDSAGSGAAGSAAQPGTTPSPRARTTSTGRTALNLVEDDFQEELEDALLPGVSISQAMAAFRDEPGAEDARALVTADMYECWSMLSLLALAAGTPGTAGRVKEALGGAQVDGDGTVRCRCEASSGPRDGDGGDGGAAPAGACARPRHDVVRDFRALHQACQSLEEEFPRPFRDLVRKLLQGQVDTRSMGSVSALRSRWESRTGAG